MSRSAALHATLLVLGLVGAAACGSSKSGAPVSSLPPEMSAKPLPGDPPPPVDAITPGVKGTLQLGTLTQLTQSQVGSAGGVITVSSPGNALDGLTLTVPKGGLPDNTHVSISSTPVTGHSYGSLVTPSTPLITIDIGEHMAADILQLRIPMTIPAGKFGLAVYYDPATGALEPLPLVSEDARSMTVATRHFSDVFGTVIDLAALPNVIDSGFRPGMDDWQFTNYGSYVSPGGHCEGQSESAMWYYLVQYRAGGASRLYGLFDNNGRTKTPDLWEDDSWGYRLASTTQEDTNWSGLLPQLYVAFKDSNDFPLLQWNAFRYGMVLTGEPLETAIFTADGGNGHDLVVYRIASNRLYGADPNYPARLRTVTWNDTTGAFDSYNSGENAVAIAEGEEHAYTKFICIAKTALLDWTTYPQRWAELKAGTIGADRDPGYTLKVSQDDGKTWIPLVDGFVTGVDTVQVRLDPTHDDQSLVVAYRGDASVAQGTTEAGNVMPLTLTLESGANDIGFAFWGQRQGWNAPKYIDFKHLTMKYQVVGDCRSDTWCAPIDADRCLPCVKAACSAQCSAWEQPSPSVGDSSRLIDCIRATCKTECPNASTPL